MALPKGLRIRLPGIPGSLNYSKNMVAVGYSEELNSQKTKQKFRSPLKVNDFNGWHDFKRLLHKLLINLKTKQQ